jgi:hypothetical protein
VSEGPIRIELERSGGFAGITLRSTLDTATLPPAQAAEVAALVDRVDLAALARQARQAGPPRGADRFQYDLTVERGGRRQHLSLPDGAVPDELRPLLDRMIAEARGA